MKGIEQAQLLAAVHAVEEPALAKAGVSSISSTMRLDGCRNEAQYCSISARRRRSSARTSGKFSSREIVDCEHNSSSEGNRSSASLNIGSPRSVPASLPSSYPAAIISMRNRIISAKRCTTFSGARGSLRQRASRSANPSRRSTSRKTSNPPSEDSRPPSKRATTALPWTGDKPGRNGVASTMAGVASDDRQIQLQQPNPTPDQSLALHPPELMHRSG